MKFDRQYSTSVHVLSIVSLQIWEMYWPIFLIVNSLIIENVLVKDKTKTQTEFSLLN